MNPGIASRERRTLLIGVLLVGAGLWLYTAYILLPLIRESGAVGERVRSARAQLKQLEASAAGEAALRSQHRELAKAVRAFRELLPAEEELPKVLEHVSGLAGQAQVKIQTIFPRRPVEALKEVKPKKGAAAPAAYFRDVFIEIDAAGGYHELGRLLDLIESEKRPMQVAGLRISADAKDPKRHHIKLSIRTYVAPMRTTISPEGRS
jgi:Tfp pilus assembly protein PilO